MNAAADQPALVHPPADTVPALMRGLCEKLETDLSQLAWLLAGQPAALPPGTIQSILQLTASIHELRRQIRD